MTRFSQRSKDRMAGIHPDLIGVAYRALQLSPIDFGITEGLRTQERQRQLVAQGASKTMNSRHLTGHAIDFAAYADGKITWDFPHYQTVASAFKQAAEEYGIPIVWGGDWEKFRDGPHVELDRKLYP